MDKEDMPLAAPMEMDRNLDGDFEDNFKDIELGTSKCALCCCIACLPCSFCTGWWTLAPKEEAIVVNCGVVSEVVTEEGCHWSNPCGRDLRVVSTTQRSYDIPAQKITDLVGNPVIISAILVYRIVEPRKAMLNVRNADNYVRNAASAALKEVIGAYTYDELKEKSDEVSDETVRILAPRVATAGAHIQSVTLNGLQYAPEIAQAMLRKQQAAALIQARQLLVEGSVDIAIKAIAALEETGNVMTDAEKAKLVSDLIVVSVGEGTGETPNMTMTATR
ncbi:Erythrocyte band 7 integral membrane protein [Hondaea fermentalgiana]|uniref:Erythrocyte band 7 integral membrane protein n=1 Tax=Hondaea fermentalgiana TaxID=2315210 RepID=A0A2R5GKP4_9STRA|nr:Erythrocyte band 7 integral membrane protein [Hondaea fermentalgiana]|eukprot:GBG28444.1 Erythrocyte band 7 integral membrane protein [Hondaea fermentalgiana]